MTLTVAVVIAFPLALASPLLYRWLGTRLGQVLTLVPLGLFAYFVSLVPQVREEPVASVGPRWVPDVGIELSWYVDGWGLLFALLVTGVGALVFWYAAHYLDREEDHGIFFLYMLVFMGAMLGVVLSNNLVALFTFWELTSVSSFLLIGFWSHRDESRHGALKALLITAIGGLFLLAGAVLFFLVGGTLTITELAAMAGDVRGAGLYPAILVCMLIAAFTKAAQVPFHLWLPNAMEAPTPVSAYLHSAAMVKAGIYLTGRMQTVLGDTAGWFLIVGLVGIITLVLAAYLALRQSDLKAILAYSTVSQLGLITALLGWGTPMALTAAAFHTLNHSIFKAGLFMMVGILDHETHTRDIRRLRGLATYMPWTAAAAVLTGLALAGVPPFNGFISKEMFFKAALAPGLDGLVGPGTAAVLAVGLPILVVLGSTLTFVYSLLIIHGVFFREPGDPVKEGVGVKPHDPGPGLLGPTLVLGGLALLIGLVPGLADRPIIEPAATALAQAPTDVRLLLWHGLDTALLMSAGVLALGLLIYARIDVVRPVLQRLPSRYNLNVLYNWAVDALVDYSAWLMDRLMTGFTRDYFNTFLGFFLVSVGLAILVAGGASGQLFASETPLTWPEALFALAAAAAALTIPLLRTRIGAVIAMGTVGLNLVILFVIFRAPDLALTLLIVETVAVVLFLLVFKFLPGLQRRRPAAGARRIDISISVATGAVVAYLVMAASGSRTAPPISDWMLENSLELAHGRNVVNVILVDFRALDTLGEIAVLGLAAIGVYMLVHLRTAPAEEEPE